MSTRTTDPIQLLEYPTTLTELRSFSELCKVFRRFGANFARVAVQRIENLRKGQLQTFDVLAEDKIPALETLRAKLVEALWLALPRSEGAYTVDTDAPDKKLNASLYKSSLTELTDQLDISIVRYMMQREHTTGCTNTANVLQYLDCVTAPALPGGFLSNHLPCS